MSQLTRYLDLKGHGARQRFADAIGVTRLALWRYEHGQRVPRPEIINRIVEETDGLVTAADFYPATPDTAFADLTGLKVPA